MHTTVRSDFPADFSGRPTPDHTLADGQPSFFIAHGRSLPSVGFCRGKLAEPAQHRLRPCDFGSFRRRRRKPALRPPKLNYVAVAVVLLVAVLVGGVSGVVDRVLLDGRRPLTDRPRPGRRSSPLLSAHREVGSRELNAPPRETKPLTVGTLLCRRFSTPYDVRQACGPAARRHFSLSWS